MEQINRHTTASDTSQLLFDEGHQTTELTPSRTLVFPGETDETIARVIESGQSYRGRLRYSDPGPPFQICAHHGDGNDPERRVAPRFT